MVHPPRRAERAADGYNQKLAVDTSLPDPGISLGVHACHDLDSGRSRDEVHEVWKSPDACPSSGFVDLLEAFRTSSDPLEAGIALRKSAPRPRERSSYHSAASSRSASAAGRTMKRGASQVRLQALVKTGANYLPGLSGIGILLEIGQAPIEFRPLGVSEGDVG
jgi:hypothetical protein